jgi:hypothetical protein
MSKRDGVDPRHLHRLGDMDTSVSAAEFIAQYATELQAEVWEYALSMGDSGWSYRDLQDAMARKHGTSAHQRSSTYRSRAKELRDAGLIRDTGMRKNHPPSKRMYAVWVRVLKGKDE